MAGWLSAAFLIACLPFATQEGPFVYWGGFLAIDVACVLLILAILDGRWIGRHFFEFKPLVALGVVSYAFYLWHLPVFFADPTFRHALERRRPGDRGDCGDACPYDRFVVPVGASADAVEQTPRRATTSTTQKPRRPPTPAVTSTGDAVPNVSAKA